MQTTSPDRIVAHFEVLMRSITPAYTYFRDFGWTRIVNAPTTEEAASHELRRYVFGVGESRLTRDCYSSGEAYTFRLEVHAACGGVEADHLVHLVNEDHLDLRACFEDEVEPGTDNFGGIFRVDDLGFEIGTSTLFAESAVHMFDVCYFRLTGLN
jgi:hypothetical protein